MSVATRELEELSKILDELRRRIKAVEAVSKETAEALSLIATLQERMLGVLERILSRLDEHSKKLSSLVRDVGRLKTGVEELEERMDRLEERMGRLEMRMNRLEERVGRLEERVDRLDARVSRIERDVSSLKMDVNSLKKDMRDVKVTIQRIAGELEDEARDAVPYMLEKVIGRWIKLKRLVVEGVVEVNLYGATDDLCVLGEVRTRIGPSVVRKLCRALLTLYEERRNLLRDRIVLVTYGLDVIEVVSELVRECGVGVLTPRGVIVEPRVMLLEEAIEACRRALEGLRRE